MTIRPLDRTHALVTLDYQLHTCSAATLLFFSLWRTNWVNSRPS